MHLPEWRQQYPKLASADMRYEDQIVLEMQKGANVPLAGDAETGAAASSDAGVTPIDAAVPAPASSRSPSGMTTRNTKATTTAKTPTSQRRDVGHPQSAAMKVKTPAKPKPVTTKAKAPASKPAVKTTKPTPKKPAAGIAAGAQ
jgi:cell division protein FtsQ